MNESEINDLQSVVAEADRLGAEIAALEARNKKRRAKGRKPLPDPQEKKDLDVLNTKYRTGDATTVQSAQAIALFERRKAEMSAADDDPDDDLDEEETPPKPPARKPKASGSKNAGDAAERAMEARAIKEAEAARHVQDLKNGRIDHSGNWSEEGKQQLDGGDQTSLPSEVLSKMMEQMMAGRKPDAPAPTGPAVQGQNEVPSGLGPLEAFKSDLYGRLKLSFESLERTLSELQGSVAAIVTASASSIASSEEEGGTEDEFKALMSQKTPVTFNVSGTMMTFDAITVFHAPPCITVVSKIGSAQIMPKAGAQLLLTYEMDGQKYKNDPVTFLGTRFDLPMFGLSFVGFIRDLESDMIDANMATPQE